MISGRKIVRMMYKEIPAVVQGTLAPPGKSKMDLCFEDFLQACWVISSIRSLNKTILGRAWTLGSCVKRTPVYFIIGHSGIAL